MPVAQTLQKLSDKDPGFGVMPGAAIVVSCYYCTSTTWAMRAFVDQDDKIVCSGCAKDAA